jgi:hypothetical protein
MGDPLMAYARMAFDEETAGCMRHSRSWQVFVSKLEFTERCRSSGNASASSGSDYLDALEPKSEAAESWAGV